jgi:5-methylcytosine-specific restriction protein A
LVGRDEQAGAVTFWVRLCWRKAAGTIEDAHSAAQLLSNVDGDRWIEALDARLARAVAAGATHLLLVQNAGPSIVRAASLPIAAVLPVWRAQRAESRRLIATRAISRKKNHAENGRSPTLWLRDVNAPTVTDLLWNYPGVRNLVALPAVNASAGSRDDVFDDLGVGDIALVGRDAATPHESNVAGFPRDPRVRALVLQLSRYRCERPNCTAVRDYPGALDVHHILGIRQSDRVNNCIALCPNCHRDAHFQPDRDALNLLLLGIARSRDTETASTN